MSCSCAKQQVKGTVVANFTTGAVRKTVDNVEYLVVPVIMLRQTVVNGAYVDASELMPASWNGVPVTLRHPMKDGKPISANSPEVLAAWAVGMIFNARIDGDKLAAEAWIDIAKAIRLNQQELLAQLEGGAPMDVSTGYFTTDVETKGVYNGKEYVVKHQDLKPDHLALLPDEEGACSWADGCGVRTNEKGVLTVKTKDMFVALARAMGFIANVEEVEMTKEKMVDLLINKKKAIEADRTGLMALSEDSLKSMTDGLETKNPDDDKKKVEPAVPATPVVPDVEAVANAVIAKMNAAGPAINAEDRAAIDAAKAIVAANRQELVSRIVANSKMTAEQLKDMSDAMLSTIATGLKPAANYSGRAAFNSAAEPETADAEELKAMSGNNIVDIINANRKGAQK